MCMLHVKKAIDANTWPGVLFLAEAAEQKYDWGAGAVDCEAANYPAKRPHPKVKDWGGGG